MAQDTGRTWLISPWLDLLFLANLAWPAMVLLCLWGGLDTHEGVRFWQIYFITTPHRWITLGLVFLDGDRYRERSGLYLWVGGLIVAFCLFVRMSTGALTCLLTIEYIWNAWHFAAQHHGIFRIYGVNSDPKRVAGLTFEKVSMRFFLIYVIMRVAGWSWAVESLEASLRVLDPVVLLIPLILVGRDVVRFHRAATGRLTYLLSVMIMYSALLGAVHFQQPLLVLILATASALFHSVEYLAMVSWAVQRKRDTTTDRPTMLARFALRWGLALTTFIVILGLGSWTMNTHLMRQWLLINLIVSYMHYAYDGLIWKVRRSNSYAR